MVLFVLAKFVAIRQYLSTMTVWAVIYWLLDTSKMNRSHYKA